MIKTILIFLEKLLPNLKDFFEKVRHSFTYNLLTYRDLLDEILNCKPMENYESASVIKDELSNKIKLRVVYLDSNNEPVKKPTGKVCGFCLFARNLDDEIKDIFGDKKIIIIK